LKSCEVSYKGWCGSTTCSLICNRNTGSPWGSRNRSCGLAINSLELNITNLLLAVYVFSRYNSKFRRIFAREGCDVLWGFNARNMKHEIRTVCHLQHEGLESLAEARALVGFTTYSVGWNKTWEAAADGIQFINFQSVPQFGRLTGHHMHNH